MTPVELTSISSGDIPNPRPNPSGCLTRIGHPLLAGTRIGIFAVDHNSARAPISQVFSVDLHRGRTHAIGREHPRCRSRAIRHNEREVPLTAILEAAMQPPRPYSLWGDKWHFP